MTKRLSEIGREMWTEPNDFNRVVAVFQHEKLDDVDVPFVILSHEERRELVREVINRWERSANWATIPQSAIEEFMEEQGL
jgi:hypothetical protein